MSNYNIVQGFIDSHGLNYTQIAKKISEKIQPISVSTIARYHRGKKCSQATKEILERAKISFDFVETYDAREEVFSLSNEEIKKIQIISNLKLEFLEALNKLNAISGEIKSNGGKIILAKSDQNKMSLVGISYEVNL